MDIGGKLLVPSLGVKFLKPTAEGLKLVPRQLAHGGFNFFDCAHGAKIIHAPDFGKQSSAKNLRADDAFGNFRHAAGHQDVEAVADFDLDDAAGAVDGNVFVHEAELVRHRRARAAAAAAGERVTCAAFPNLNLDVSAVEDF